MYRWIWEAIHIRKQDRSMNRDEGSYQLPNVYDCLLPSQRHLVDIRSEEGSSSCRNVNNKRKKVVLKMKQMTCFKLWVCSTTHW